MFYIMLSIIVNVILGILPTISLIMMQRIINFIQLGNTKLNIIGLYVFLYVSVDILTSIISNLYGKYNTRITLEFTQNVEVKLLKKVTSLELEDFEDSELHNMISRARNEGSTKIMGFFTSTLTIGKQILSIITSTMIVSLYQPLLLIFILALPIIKYLYAFKMNIIKFNINRNRTSRERKKWYISHLIFSGLAFKEIRVNGLKNYLIEKYTEFYRQSLNEDILIAKKMSKMNIILSTIDNMISGSIFLYIVNSGLKNTILIGDVVTYTRCIFNIKSYIETIFGLFDGIGRDALFVSQFFELMSREEKVCGNIKIGTIKNIKVCNLSYKYKDSTRYVLKNVSFNVSLGDIVLIVGLNGSGKTTLLKILLGYYSNFEGEVLINDIDIRNLDKADYYMHVSCIFQDFIKFELSVRENISFGEIKHLNNDLLLKKMLEFSGFNHGRRLDLDTMLGSWFEQAQQLSGGEWQRIALARAFIKDADVYVLDEPDAALDVVTEHNIVDKYIEIMHEKIGICTSHRFSRISFMANSIIVLDNGSILEQGSHEELMQQRGGYYNLYLKSINSDFIREIDTGVV